MEINLYQGRMMQIFSLYLALVCAASFTSSLGPGTKPVDAFVKYQGNRENLAAILKLFGSVSESFDLDAVTLDELISNEIIITALLPFKGLDINFHKLGGLLSDLSPARFDHLCTMLDAGVLEVTEMVRGYSPKQPGSKWKAAIFELPFVKSIPSALLAKVTPQYCEYLARHPDEILTARVAQQCIDIWMKSERRESMRQALRHPLWFLFYHLYAAKAFEGHEMEYIDLLCKLLQSEDIFMIPEVILPEFIKASHILPLIKLILSKSWPYALEIKSLSKDQDFQDFIVTLNREIRERDFVFPETFFDSEDFMGKWALPKCMMPWVRRQFPHIHNLNENHPMQLSQALDVFWIYGNENILKNTLAFLSELVMGHELHIQQQYFEWLPKPRPHSKLIKRIAMLVKPFLKSLPAQWQLQWHLRPLYQEMDANPSDFWPTEILADGTKWVKEQLKAVALSEDEIVEAIKAGRIVPDGSFYAYAIDFSRTKLLPFAISPQNRLVTPFLHKITPCYISFYLNLHDKDSKRCEATLMTDFNSKIIGIAASANEKMLMVLQRFFKPHQILSQITNIKIRNRIALMMHLNHEVDSYLGAKKINKNSIFFRNWVMLHFSAAEGQKTADLKLLNFYFHLRCNRNYPGFDLFNCDETGNHMVLGLLNEPGIECRRSSNRNWDLTFEPTSSSVENRKRDREDDDDDENSSNKRQKTEQ